MRTLIYSLLAVVLLVAPTNVASADSDQDREMALEIANNMKVSGQLKDYRVGVKYHDGVAWLSGTITSEKQKAAAEQIARRSAGVERIVSKLVVSPQQMASRNSPSGKQVKSTQRNQQKKVVRTGVQPVVNIDNYSKAGTLAETPARARPEAPSVAKRRPTRQSRQRVGNNKQRVGNNMPRPYARIAQRPQGQPARGGQQARGGQPVHPASYGGPGMGGPGMGGPGMGGPGMGGGSPMAAAGSRPVSYDSPQMPGYAWPSYAANPNYAALTYPKQYSPAAWPYIGPFYPYPQVPLGWRKVTLEWDDGWWFLDFKDQR